MTPKTKMCQTCKNNYNFYEKRGDLKMFNLCDKCRYYEKGTQDTLKAVTDGKIVKPFRCPVCDKITTLTCVECAEKEFTQEEKARCLKKIRNCKCYCELCAFNQPRSILHDKLIRVKELLGENNGN